ncbi:hypothetical protein [Arenibaculum pallidiluteum]|uniref:hypothetical protein n=1 Tax=Arenibaculum pallidiluteum TaxID=2812559 RepID=UPI0022A6D10E|nr:hypothetical protein [Arenibaculum pallidiluteum]
MRALESRGALDSLDGRIAVGWLVVEDLAMVIALVLLPAVAGSEEAGCPGATSPRRSPRWRSSPP